MAASSQHIVILFHDFSFGGTEVIALRLAAEWVRAGRWVTILCGTPDGPLRASVPAGVRVETLDPVIGRSLWSRLRLRRAMRGAIGRLEPDILFLPGNFHLILAGAVRGLSRPPRVVAKISNPLAPAASLPLRWLLDRAFRWAARDIDWLVAMSTGLARDARRLVGADRVSVIHDPNALHPVCAEALPFRASPGPLRLLAAGRLVPQKDFALAIRVAAQVAKSRDVELTIVGDGPDRAALAALARRLGIADRVRLTGHMPSIAAALDATDLLLVTSRYEGGPAVAVEALERGVPVIATDCSYFLHDILTDPNFGRLVSTRDPARFATQLLQWTEDDRRRPFSPRTATQGFTLSAAVTRYLQLFDGLAARRSGGVRDGLDPTGPIGAASG